MSTEYSHHHADAQAGRTAATDHIGDANKMAPAEVLNAPGTEWKKYEGDWNAASNPSDPGCFRIRGGVVFHINPFTGEERFMEDSRTLERLVDAIKAGSYVPNLWPIPPDSEAARMFADFIADNPAERFRRTEPVKRFAEKVIERLRAQSDPANTEREIGLHVAMNVVRQMAEEER